MGFSRTISALCLLSAFYMSGSSVVSPEYAAAVRSIIGQSYDFSKVAVGSKLSYGSLQLNKANLRMSTGMAAEIAPLLHGDSLSSRMEVWGNMAQYARLWSGSAVQKKADIRDLDVFQGDIILTPEQSSELLETAKAEKLLSQSSGKSRIKRKITSSPDKKWGTVIYWNYYSTFTAYQRNVIQQGLDFWESRTCLNFVRKLGTIRGPHIKFVKKVGCKSKIGKQPTGQEISIGTGCDSIGVVTHEIGHALGMWHEQSRPDRDDHVWVYPNNADSDKRHNFGKISWSLASVLGVPYDYGSVMHYPTKAFSTRGSLTVNPKKIGFTRTIGQRNGPSFYDVKIINFQYCSNKCSSTTRTLHWNSCRNDGYRNPKQCSRCVCPQGFLPPYCTSLDSPTSKCGTSSLQASTSWKYLTSPGYPSGYPGPLDCTWKISTTFGHLVQLRFVSPFSVGSCNDACREYVEVRDGYPSETGKRFCCGRPPYYTFTSESAAALMVLLHTKSSSRNVGFKARYRSVPCGGCSGSSTYQQACMNRYRSWCTSVYYEKCGSRTCRRTKSTICFKTNRYCCYHNNYELKGSYCKKKTKVQEWAAWGSWTCQSQIRRRTCRQGSGKCRGSTYEKRNCGTSGCPGGSG